MDYNNFDRVYVYCKTYKQANIPEIGKSGKKERSNGELRLLLANSGESMPKSEIPRHLK